MSDRVSFYNFVTSGDGMRAIATQGNNGGLAMKTQNAYEFAEPTRRSRSNWGAKIGRPIKEFPHH